MGKIVIDTSNVKGLTQEGGKFVFKPSAETALIALLTLKDQVDAAVEEAKAQITEAGYAITPDFRGVVGERVKAIMKKAGAKYDVSGECGEEFVKRREVVTVDSGAVDEYRLKNNKLPDGIIERVRDAKLYLSKIDDEAKRLP